MGKKQDATQKKGEIEFRLKLYQQQVCGYCLLANEFDKEEMLGIMRARIDKSRRDFAELAKKGFLRSPFLELGAERCQRSLLLANEFRLGGFAADISFESLKYADFLAETIGYQVMPRRLCCDAYRLPLADCSIAFAFCYQTLHHFPEPLPVLQELYRVLQPGGVVYVDEEPIKRTWKVPLFKRKSGVYSVHNRYLRFVKNYILDFFSEPRCNECDFGICENDEISLREWERALSALEGQAEIRLKILPGRVRMASRVNHQPRRWTLGSHLTNGLGGGLTALVVAQKSSTGARSEIQPTLACPACFQPLREEPQEGEYICTACKNSYPMVEGILFALRPAEFESLYPYIRREYLKKREQAHKVTSASTGAGYV